MPFRWLLDCTICFRLFEVMLKCLLVYQNTTLFVSLEHKTSLKSLGYICSNSQQCIVWVKIIVYNTFPTVNMSNMYFLLIMCIVKNLWTTLKAIFSIFHFFCTPKFKFLK